ncbi:hypothetical protein SAMN05421688_1308 [Poseidonocella pacifica]|uniref:DUF2125 domain-containing protein n=1 Tax=Poseidonocella pacifica TaxID=871651 RepID=A0A1I0WD71_9RHOB|nr:DUF2125 domain-containing protein [Poseidonocella pacifica]SFA86705.1 hypothetical protein SAMN05421688_1308 [Poseidonocella pacifica]
MRALSATVLLALSLAAPVRSEVSVEEVWEAWQARIAAQGSSVEGSVSIDGELLTITDMRIDLDVQDGPDVVLETSGVVLRDLGDGRVAVELPETLPMTLTHGLTKRTANLNLRQIGLRIIVSGEPDDLQQAYSAEELALDVPPASDQTGDTQFEGAELIIRELVGATQLKAEGQSTDLRAVTAQARLNFRSKREGIPLTTAIRAGYQRLAASSSVSAAPEGAPASAASQMARVSYDGAELGVIETGADATSTISLTSGSGTLEASNGNGRLSYELTSEQGSLDAAIADAPFPVSVSFDNSLLRTSFPIVPSDEAEDFDIALQLGALQVSDMLWQALDPQNALDHGPASLAVDLSGKMRTLVNLLEQQQPVPGVPQAEVYDLSINQFDFAIAGASLAAAGTFSFDHDDKSTFEGMPRPEGFLDVTLEGADKLLDGLTTMKLLPADQAAGIRMMLGMFSTPAGEGRVTSRLEINEAGEVSANGQRLR